MVDASEHTPPSPADGGALARAGAYRISDKAFFLSLIIAATVLPLLFVPFAAPIRGAHGGIDDVFRLLLLMSTMHVGLTSFFYLDTEYRGHVAKHAGFYIFLPVAVILAAGATTYFFAAAGVTYLQLFYHAWLLFHYGRQNYGVLAFTAGATGSGRPSVLERLALHLAPIGGILGANQVFAHFSASIFAPYLELSVRAGAALTIAAIALAVLSALKQILNRTSIWRPLMVVMLSLFYLPTFFFDNYMQAVMGYAIAHALQYFVFMFFLAAGARWAAPGRAIVVLGLGALATWGIILLTREDAIWGPILPFVTGAALGLIMWHFILDAGFWRLSQPWQRERVRERFSFLFAQGR
mgnify:FL=1